MYSAERIHVEGASLHVDVPPIPIFGNGDCYDYREYYENMEMSGADGVMIARGALNKVWTQKR